MTLLAAGSNAKGQLGSRDALDRTSFISSVFEGSNSPESLDLLQIASGANHTLILCRQQASLLANGPTYALWGCGDGSKGQLLSIPSSHIFKPLDLTKLGVTSEGYIPTVIAACWETSFVVLTPEEGPHSSRPDVLISFGSNDYGDRGVLEPSQSFPTAVPIEPVINQIKGLQVACPTVYRIPRISCGPHHVLAVVVVLAVDGLEREIVVGWGASRHGQLELNLVSEKPHDTSRRPTGRQLFAQTPRTVLALPHPRRVMDVSLGQQHSVVIDDEGHVYVGGSNRKSQLASIHTISAIVSLGCTWNGTYLISQTPAPWRIYSTGSGTKGQLGHHKSQQGTSSGNTHSSSNPLIMPQEVAFPPQIAETGLVGLACGSEHVLALIEDSSRSRSVWGWGWNEHGNFGTGSTDDMWEPIRIWPSSMDANSKKASIIRIWAGCGTSWIWLAD